ncbi:hypothetical protein BBK36DRAFT_1091847, partial [Trichoderma citrinoviride]
HGLRRLQESPGVVDDGLALLQGATSHAIPEELSPTEVKAASAKIAAVKEIEEAVGEALERAHGNKAAASTRPGEAALVEHSYWPTVRQYIDNGGHAGHTKRIRPVCPICSDELTIYGIDPTKDELIERAFYSIEEMPPFTRCALLLCGHMFCPDCLARTFEADREMHRGRACPVCRFKVDCEPCGRLGCVVNLPVTGIAARWAEFPSRMAEG